MSRKRRLRNRHWGGKIMSAGKMGSRALIRFSALPDGQRLSGKAGKELFSPGAAGRLNRNGNVLLLWTFHQDLSGDKKRMGC